MARFDLAIDTDAAWLGALMASESNEPHEWPFVGWAVRNRVESTSRYPDNYVGVIRQPMQFSFWNQWERDDPAERVYAEACAQRIRHQLEDACACARWLLFMPGEACPFPRDTYYFWSPCSMKPEGRLPTWAQKLERFTPQGVDPWRFIFGRERS